MRAVLRADPTARFLHFSERYLEFAGLTKTTARGDAELRFAAEPDGEDFW